MKPKSAIMIMPRPSTAWRSSVALWITAAGWAAAAERLFGNAWVITTDCVTGPKEVLTFPAKGIKKSGNGLRKFLPSHLTTLVKDFMLWKGKNRKVYADAPWQDTNVQFVWEQHDLFCGPGYKLARKLGVPFVIYVHAPVVWESRRWGVNRPLWGKLLEQFSESISLRRADLVACVSFEVAEKLKEMGVNPNKIIVSPMAVDAHLFKNASVNSTIKEELKLEDKTIIGWTGSFRRFHGLEGVVRSFAQVVATRSDVYLLLVGDGPERSNIERLVSMLGIADHVLFSGHVPFKEMPMYITAFDIALVSASSAENFHYSPLKLREYMAASCAVVAPRAGEIVKLFSDERELLMYDVGNITELTFKLLKLINDPQLRKNLALKGNEWVLQNGTWDWELNRISMAITSLQA
ncbi:MAG: glycosyltransferase [Sediminibacterium sp.]